MSRDRLTSKPLQQEPRISEPKSEPKTEPTPREIKILIVDDSEDDAELVMRAIARSGMRFTTDRVQSPDGLRSAIELGAPDAIICDHKMPGFTSLDALTLVHETGLDVPFLIVSGVIGEQVAVEAMRAGAHDYIMKNDLGRLVPALERELREARQRSDRRLAQTRLRESEHRFRTLAEMAPILIWESNANQQLAYMSSQWREWWSSEQFDVILRGGWETLVHPQDRDHVKSLVLRAAGEHQPWTCEFRLMKGADDWRFVVANARPKTSASGDYAGFIGIIADVTEQMRARREAEAANRAKSEFLANMSHEIRTPMSAILGFADLLREEGLDRADRDQYLDIIIRNGNELLRIIGDILDLSKVEAGKFVIDSSLFRVREMVNELRTLLEMRAREKGLELLVEVDQDVGDFIESDRTRLRQILINIVGNAIKFTSRGFVRLRVSTDVSKGPHALVFSVEDTGAGIPKEQRARLFQPFSQVDNSSTRIFGGTGLGLILSRHLAHALGGEVWIDDEYEGSGARFLVSIAGEPVHETSQAATSVHEFQQSRQPYTQA